MTRFRNPVVRGFAPDPSVCRVGDDFYLASSSFEFFPAIPIRHSTDLVHWELIGHAVTDPTYLRPDREPGPFILFAPTLRHHEGRFFVSCTNIAPRDPAVGRSSGFTGNFITRTEDPRGDWSAPTWVDQEAFDPSLTFADDTVYYTRRTLDLTGGAAGHGPIVQGEVDPLTGRLTRELAPISPDNGGFCSNDIEGPHLYKIGDLYYLLSAEGGTEHGHMVTVGRSPSPYGPFEPAPHNPLLTHRHLTLLEIQCAGHADLVEAPDGTWWALFLAQRERWMAPQLLGRETFLARVTWEDGWPHFPEVVELEMDGPDLPRAPSSTPVDDPWLAGWQTRQAAVGSVYLKSDALTLETSPASLDDDGPASAVFLRQQEYDASLAATLTEPPAGGTAGLTAYITPDRHYELFVTGVDSHRNVTLRRRAADLVHEQTVPLTGTDPVTLRVTCDGDEYDFSATSGDQDVRVGSGAAKLLGSEVAPGFGSVRIGLFATGDSGTATFDGITTENLG